MKKLEDIKKKLAEAQAKYHEVVHKVPGPVEKAAADKVKACRKELSDAICEGAKTCKCGAMPVGLEQPRPDGKGMEFEVGCPACGERVRGGLLPRHTVEAWNEK